MLLLLMNPTQLNSQMGIGWVSIMQQNCSKSNTMHGICLCLWPGSLILLWVIESGCPIHRSNNMGSVWSVVRSAEHLRGICRPQRVLWRNTLYYIIWVLSMVVNYIYQDQFIASFVLVLDEQRYWFQQSTWQWQKAKYTF